MRLFGRAMVCPLEQSPLADLLSRAQAEGLELPMRQVVDIRIESTQTSCGYGVPVFEYVSERIRAQRGRRYK